MPAWVGHGPQQLENTARYFPAVGILVGLLSAATLLISNQVLPASLTVALSMAAGLLITGAFHEDGLSDFADGMGGGFTREKILAIMKDSRIGAYGAIALILTLLIKYQALLELCRSHSVFYAALALIAGHALSRLMATSLLLTQDYIREDESARAKPATQRISTASFVVACLFGLLPLLLLPASNNLVLALLAAVLVRAWLAWRLQSRLGGYTGDCLGAVQQLTELSFYLGLAAAL